jgi:polyisoprenoid-binding protein YceI
MSSSFCRLLTLSVACVATFAFAGWTKQGEALASFKATGPAGFKIVGSTKNVEIKDEGANIVVSLKLTDVDTDNSLRNKHMLEDLEAEKLPLCSLTVPLASLKEDGKDAEAKGVFSLHGKTHEVAFKYTSSCADGVCSIDGSAEINLKDYDVKVRSYLGITVKSEVAVTAKFQLKK